MTDNRPRMTPEQIVNFLVSNGRLAGLDTDPETLEIVRKIAYGEMSDDEIDEWKRRKVLEFRSEAVKERLRLKYLPWNFDLDKVDGAEAFLALSDVEQTDFFEFKYNEEAEFYISLLTARALYVHPLDKRDGSITQAKLDRHHERYRMKP